MTKREPRGYKISGEIEKPSPTGEGFFDVRKAEKSHGFNRGLKVVIDSTINWNLMITSFDIQTNDRVFLKICLHIT